MTAPSASSASLLGLPIEILLDIYQHLDLASTFQLSLANSSLLDFFKRHKSVILLPILIKDFSPFDELLQIHTASADDLAIGGAHYVPRKIVFQRFPGDSGQILAPSCESSAKLGNQSSEPEFISVTKLQKPMATAKSDSRTVVLTERDLDPILKHCQLVRKWEQLFPQMRWFHEPENCRTLRTHEGSRFRKALYRWWLYSIYFHGEQPRPRVGLPEPYVEDIRTSQMRRHSTSELLELMDLVETMKDVVLQYICPRLDPNHMQSNIEPILIEYSSRGQSLATSWNDQSRWARIVKTYGKLGPADLMHYFENIYSYPRQRLITEVHLRHPNFTFDQESIQIAIRCALDERRWLDRAPSLAEDSVGGILDFDDERDAERLLFNDDANPDGMLPAGSKFVRSFSQYSPRGDDGTYLEEQRPYGAPSRLMGPAAMGWVR